MTDHTTDDSTEYDDLLREALARVEHVRRHAPDDDTTAAGWVVEVELRTIERRLHLVRFALESWDPDPESDGQELVTDGGVPRRDVLRGAGAAAGLGALPSVSAVGTAGARPTDSRPAVDDDRDEWLRAAFADVPRLHTPPESHRDWARLCYPPVVVPDTGPIPDPVHDYQPSTPVYVTDWVIESIVHRLRWEAEENGRLPTPGGVGAIALEYVQPQSVMIGGEISRYPDVELVDIIEERVGLRRDAEADDGE